MSRISRIVAWLPALAWATFIFWLSAQSYPPTPGPEFPFKDKVGHLGLYVILASLLLLPLRYRLRLPLPKAAVLAILLTSAYGASDEFHQRFVPRRTCDVWDWAADTTGGIVAAAACYAYESCRSQRANRAAPRATPPP